MKYITFFIVLLVLSGVLFTSCYKEIDLEKYRPTPKVVINTALAADSLITASITRTWFFTDTETNPNVYLTRAKVDLYINDAYKETMNWEPYEENSPAGCFVSTTLAREGDKIKIVATDKEYGTAWAEEVVPKPIKIENIAINITQGVDEETIISYQITFKDIPDEKNFYLIQIEIDSYGKLYPISIDYSSDPVLSHNESLLNNAFGYDGLEHTFGCLFTDELIAGKEYTLKMKEKVSSYADPTGERIITLYNLSESYYQYLLSLQKLNGSQLTNDLVVIGFAEPLRIYSNIKGGTGILGTSQHNTHSVEISADDLSN